MSSCGVFQISQPLFFPIEIEVGVTMGLEVTIVEQVTHGPSYTQGVPLRATPRQLHLSSPFKQHVYLFHVF